MARAALRECRSVLAGLCVMHLIACTAGSSKSDSGVTSDAGAEDAGCLSETCAPDAGCLGDGNWQVHAGNPLLKYEPTALDGNPGDPSVVFADGGYVMFYGAARGDFSDPLLRIFRATSPDGISWQRNATAVLVPGPDWDTTNVETPSVFRRADGTWAMYYAGNSTSSNVGFQIGLATSPDGLTWTRVGNAPVLTTTASELSLIGPSVLFDDATHAYVMLYAAINASYTIDIYRATSEDGTHWVRHGIVLRMSDVERQSAGDLGVMGPELLKTAQGFELVYNSLIAPSVDGGTNRSGGIYHARSVDTQTWTKRPAAIYLPTRGNLFDAVEVGAQSWLKTSTGYRLWYVGTNTDYRTRYDNGIGLLERSCP